MENVGGPPDYPSSEEEEECNTKEVGQKEVGDLLRDKNEEMKTDSGLSSQLSSAVISATAATLVPAVPASGALQPKKMAGITSWVTCR
jgi:hypothetical protein